MPTIGRMAGIVQAAGDRRSASSLPRVPVEPINGAELFYEAAGAGSAVVLLHTGVTDSGMWDGQFEAHATEHRVVRYDLRGFGRSTLPGGPYSLVDDLRALLDLVGIERVGLVGGSVGGSVAVDFALAHPVRVGALVLAAPALGGHEWSKEMRRFGAEEDAALDAGELERAVEMIVELWLAGPRRGLEVVEPALVERVRAMQRNAFEVQLAAYAADPPPQPVSADPPAAERLGEIAVPTLVLAGEEDLGDFLAIADRVETEVPGAREVLLPDTGHLLTMERPERFSELLDDFLREFWP